MGVIALQSPSGSSGGNMGYIVAIALQKQSFIILGIIRLVTDVNFLNSELIPITEADFSKSELITNYRSGFFEFRINFQLQKRIS